MNTLTKMALGMIGSLKPRPAQGDASQWLALPEPDRAGGMPLMQAIAKRQSLREFRTDPLPLQTLSDLLWAAFGINRPEPGGRTAPSALNAQEIDVYAALPEGLYLYEPAPHRLRLVVATDVRRVTGYQDFVDEAPLDLVLVADHSRLKMVPASKRESYASVAAGAITQNVYLYCASAGLATVTRAWIDRGALSAAMGLEPDQQVILSQTVGMPKS